MGKETQIQWALKHVVSIAEQVEKRWDDNPSSVKLSGTDANFVQIPDIELIYRVDGYTSRRENVWIQIKDKHGGFNQPSIFSWNDRQAYNRAIAKFERVHHELRHGKPDELDKLICEVFPGEFDKYIDGSKDK